ncbi:hypothetical protein [Kaarinaea lacus]
MNTVEPVTIAHVHAYVDDQLTDIQAEMVEQYFDNNPQKFDELQQYLSINDKCHAVFGHVLQQQIPEEMLETVYGDHGEEHTVGHLENQLRGSLVKQCGSLVSSVNSISQRFTAGRSSVRMFANKLYAWLQLDKLENAPWFVALRNRIPEWSSIQGLIKQLVLRLTVVLRVHPSNAPPRLLSLWQWIPNAFAHGVASLRTMNVYAVSIIVCIGMIVGIYIQSSYAWFGGESIIKTVERQAQHAHALYTTEGRSLLVADTNSQLNMVTWLSNRFGKEIKLAEFAEQGLENVGAVLLPSHPNYALLHVYENTEMEKASLYINPHEEAEAKLQCSDALSSRVVCSWSDKGILYVLVSELSLAQSQLLIAQAGR